MINLWQKRDYNVEVDSSFSDLSNWVAVVPLTEMQNTEAGTGIWGIWYKT